jgi:hypothetical protein
VNRGGRGAWADAQTLGPTAGASPRILLVGSDPVWSDWERRLAAMGCTVQRWSGAPEDGPPPRADAVLFTPGGVSPTAALPWALRAYPGAAVWMVRTGPLGAVRGSWLLAGGWGILPRDPSPWDLARVQAVACLPEALRQAGTPRASAPADTAPPARGARCPSGRPKARTPQGDAGRCRGPARSAPWWMWPARLDPGAGGAVLALAALPGVAPRPLLRVWLARRAGVDLRSGRGDGTAVDRDPSPRPASPWRCLWAGDIRPTVAGPDPRLRLLADAAAAVAVVARADARGLRQARGVLRHLIRCMGGRRPAAGRLAVWLVAGAGPAAAARCGRRWRVPCLWVGEDGEGIAATPPAMAPVVLGVSTGEGAADRSGHGGDSGEEPGEGGASWQWADGRGWKREGEGPCGLPWWPSVARWGRP